MNVNRSNEQRFTLKKPRSRIYPAETITDADYADDLALLANTPAQAESLLHNLCIGLYVNPDKTVDSLEQVARHLSLYR